MRTSTLLRVARRSTLVAAALVTIVSVPAARASAAVPAPFLAYQQTLAALHSYRETATSVLVDKDGSRTALSTAVVVRRGGRMRVYIRAITPISPTGTLLIEEVGTGSHLCRRDGGEGYPWSCTRPDTLSPTFPSTPSAIHRIDADLHVRFLGMGMREGQRCSVYALRGSSATFHSTGTIWIARATSYPIEQDSTFVITAAGQTTIDRMRTVWSDENDPNLTIPNVPAS